MTATDINWEKKYYELLEKHNDYIDELMGENNFEGCPDIFLLIKFVCVDIDINQADEVSKQIIEKMGLRNIKYANVIFPKNSPEDRPDFDVSAIPLKKLLLRDGLKYCDDIANEITNYLKGTLKDENR